MQHCLFSYESFVLSGGLSQLRSDAFTVNSMLIDKGQFRFRTQSSDGLNILDHRNIMNTMSSDPRHCNDTGKHSKGKMEH